MATGTSGWKARQERARTKMRHGKTKAERDAITAERNRIYAEQAMQAEKVSKGTGESMAPVEGNTLSGGHASKAREDISQMSRDAMVSELTDAGDKRPGPNTKLETLQAKVADLRG